MRPANSTGRLVSSASLTQIREQDVCALPREGNGDSTPDAAIATGDDGFSVQKARALEQVRDAMTADLVLLNQERAKKKLGRAGSRSPAATVVMMRSAIIVSAALPYSSMLATRALTPRRKRCCVCANR